MLTERLAVTALRVVLAVLFAVLIPFETLSLPGQFAYLARQNPDEAYLRWPSTAVTVFWVVCVQVVIVATWKLLTLVRRDRIFTEGALVWVDVIVWAIAAAWLTLVGVFLWVGLRADDPGPIVAFFLMTAGVTVLGLLMVVMRALLRQATTLRTDMEAVI
ncbi:DUF2975 domain-containing protein [Micromonospora siamensis]|uniref:DUF2975 domain-containing protein n=1 Tax=Micromonospora siamensis TaxID=299152 RepID=A0A1C5ICD1_9ACTN|nr:DUF2975 domain-containing protein [Micromonospora siamensis]SCG56010.1 Protein of unknown function [Micromonospora siamensis]